MAEDFPASIKVRVPEEWKLELEARAKHEGLDMSDIARRAIRNLITSTTKQSKKRGVAK